jgi:hypothetical protein
MVEIWQFKCVLLDFAISGWLGVSHFGAARWLFSVSI